jgi:hypothetical protein
MPIADDELMAYADGELDAQRRSEIELALRTDAQLAQRVRAHQAMRKRVQAAFDDELTEPMPGGVLRALETRERAEASNDASWGWRRWGGIAASLLIGLLIGRTLLPSGAPIAWQADDVVAGGALERALSTQLASAATEVTSVRVPISFVDRSGRYCRAFQADRQAGVACRSEDRWVVQALVVDTPTSAASGALRQAASALPSMLLDEIDARIAGVPLNSAQETSARESGWRR